MRLLFVAFVGGDLRTRSLQFVLGNRPYEERVAGFDLQVVALVLGAGLRRALEAQPPALEILQAETFM